MQTNNNNPNKGNSNNSNDVKEQAQPRIILADLFKVPVDKVEAEAERDANFGYPSRNNNNKSGSFGK